MELGFGEGFKDKFFYIIDFGEYVIVFLIYS